MHLEQYFMSKRFLQSPSVHLGNGNTLENAIIVLNADGSIENIGINLEVPSDKIEHFEGLLCPGFINTHCHLELSHLKGKVKEKTKLNGFIREVQALRNVEKEIVDAAIIAADEEMHANGIVAVGDISNTTATYECKQASAIYYHSFIELFAFNPAMAKETFEKGLTLKKEAETKNINASIVPHAPYSVSDLLFEKIANAKNNAILSIHNQETAAENELFQKGEGKMMEMLLKFGNKKEDFKITAKNSLPSYLSKLPTEKPLLLVHNTYSNQEDIAFAEKLHQNLYWCFCPNANLYIENRLADIPSFVAAGVKITLGTDSLASNHQLSILEEMKTIQQAFPEISTAQLIKWATKNGANFLGLEQYGELKVGSKSGILQLHKLNGKQLGEHATVNRIA